MSLSVKEVNRYVTHILWVIAISVKEVNKYVTHISRVMLISVIKGIFVIYLVACWITDHYHLSLILGMDISEWCFNFNFTSLAAEVTRPI